jgi:hypothetical protein
MRYVCHRRARFEGISGRVNIPYGAALERRGDFLYYEGRQLCAAGSQRAHEHFKRDDDGQGLRRGALTEAICKTLERRDAGPGPMGPGVGGQDVREVPTPGPRGPLPLGQRLL